MLDVLPEPASTIVAVAGFAGVREGELRGLLWENCDGKQLSITRSVWRSYVLNPKTKASVRTSPGDLAAQRKAEQSPSADGQSAIWSDFSEQCRKTGITRADCSRCHSSQPGKSKPGVARLACIPPGSRDQSRRVR
jgi:hypothetical protein